MNKKIIAILTFLPAIAFANPDFMDDPGVMKEPSCKHRMPGMSHGHHGQTDGDRLPRFLHHLDLTVAQQDSIKALLKADKAAMDEKFKTGRQGFDELHNLVFSSVYSEAKAEVLIEKSAALHKQMALQKTKLEHAIFEKLTPEQQQKLKADKAGKPAMGTGVK